VARPDGYRGPSIRTLCHEVAVAQIRGTGTERSPCGNTATIVL
jgi:hypothetical protein